MLKILELILDTVYPKHCLGCDAYGIWFCNDCLSGVFLRSDIDKSERQIKEIFAVCHYQQKLVQEIIHSYKYHFIKELSEPIARLIISYINCNREYFQNYDFVIAVPLSEKRLLWRGYNQSEEIAKYVCKHFGWSYRESVLVRKSNSKPQALLKHKYRSANISKGFKCVLPGIVKGKNVLIIDDVYTTGSTLKQCAVVLKKADVKSVSALVFARE